MVKFFTILTGLTLAILLPDRSLVLAQDAASEASNQVVDKVKTTKKTKKKNTKIKKNEKVENESSIKNQTGPQTNSDAAETFEYVQAFSLYLLPEAQINRRHLTTSLIYQNAKTRVKDSFKKSEYSLTKNLSAVGARFSQPITPKIIAGIGFFYVSTEEKRDDTSAFKFNKLLIPLTVSFKLTNMIDAGFNIFHHKDTFKVASSQLNFSYETFEILLGVHSKSFEASISHQPAIKNKNILASSNASSTNLRGQYRVFGGFSVALGQGLTSSDQQKNTSYLAGVGFTGKSLKTLLALKQKKSTFSSDTEEPKNSFLAEVANLNTMGLPILNVKAEYVPGSKRKPANSSSEYETDASVELGLAANFYF